LTVLAGLPSRRPARRGYVQRRSADHPLDHFSQMQAFQRDGGAAAYSYASPGIQGMYPVSMASWMVKRLPAGLPPPRDNLRADPRLPGDRCSVFVTVPTAGTGSPNTPSSASPTAPGHQRLPLLEDTGATI
jgi:hypothetical protein